MALVFRMAGRALVMTLVGAMVSCAPSGERTMVPGDAEPDYAAVDLLAEPPPAVSSSEGSTVAEAMGARVEVFRRPGQAQPWTSLRNPGPFNTNRVFLVRGSREGWLRVLLPIEPNGSEGWIRDRQVQLWEHSFRIEVDITDRRLTAFRGDRILLREPVAVGTDATPTPTGLFFTTVLARPNDPSGPYGPFAYGLSGHSEVLDTFAGGDGQVGIHGTNNPWSIGQAVSHGCIRLRNEAITRLARILPLGTPVRVSR